MDRTIQPDAKRVLMLASVASMIDQFNMPNIRLMQQLGYQVHVACNFKNGNTCSDARVKKLVRVLKKMSVRCHQWDCPREIFPVKPCVQAYRQLSGLLSGYRFAWIHCHSPVGGALARIAAARWKVPVIYTAHGFHFYQGAPFKNWIFYYPAEKLLSYRTDMLVTVNREDDRFARTRLNAGRVFLIPGVGIAVKRFFGYRPRLTKKEFCQAYLLPADATVLLSVGELSERKNHQLVISVLPLLKPSVCYLVCGQGEQREALLRQARQAGVLERVRLAGYVEDLREIYSHADLFVFPSLQEGMPVALLEAMASGIPCLVSDIRGNRELVRQDCARFDPGSGRELLLGLRRLLEDPSLLQANRRQNQKRAAGYDSFAVQQRMRRIYQEMEQSVKFHKGSERLQQSEALRQTFGLFKKIKDRKT